MLPNDKTQPQGNAPGAAGICIAVLSLLTRRGVRTTSICNCRQVSPWRRRVDDRDRRARDLDRQQRELDAQRRQVDRERQRIEEERRRLDRR